MKSKILIVLMMLYASMGYSQNEFVYGQCLKEVHFGGTQNTNYIPITKDDSSGEYMAPQFVKDNGGNCSTQSNGTVTKSDPVAYVSGTKARVKAIFETNCSTPQYIRGLGPYISVNQTSVRIEFPKQLATPSGGEIVYDWKDANRIFVNNEVKYFEKFKIKWQISKDGNSEWIDIDESENTLYVTHDVPLLTTANGHLEPTVAFHTLLHIASSNADGENIENDIVEKIYFEFNDQVVNRVDGIGPIQYWGPNISTPGCWQTSQMLINLNGTCGGWAAFFEDVIRLQGISSSELSTVTYNDYVLSSSDVQKLNIDAQDFLGLDISNLQALPHDNIPNTIRSDFFVKNWNLASSGIFVMNDYFNNVSGITPVPIQLANGNIISIEEQIGVTGQGNNDPRSEFENHAIVKYGSKYFDPSYGSPIQPSANSWETPSLDGFGSVMVYNHNNQFYYVNWIGHLNDSTLQSNVSP
ncbi:MAG TPA: hypothetical protein ENK91_11810 [Bacteroidetes bacterium]|nr:hypothetical protein [Bacteroidota bacterium]